MPAGKNEAFIEKQWAPGQSGNPSGRRKGEVNLLSTLRRQLAEQQPGEKRTFAEAVVAATIRDALAGDPSARKLVWEYVEGPATEARQAVTVNVGVGILPEEYQRRSLAEIIDIDPRASADIEGAVYRAIGATAS